MVKLTWDLFDEAVEQIARSVHGVTAVHGIPRGGLPLAVALSHRLGVPMSVPGEGGVLVLDDIRDSGETLKPYDARGDLVWTWVGRLDGRGNAVIRSDAWIIFPWEVPDNAHQELSAYMNKREVGRGQ